MLRKKLWPSHSKVPDLPERKRANDLLPQFARQLVTFDHQSVAAIAEIGDEYRCLARTARGIQFLQVQRVHQPSLST